MGPALVAVFLVDPAGCGGEKILPAEFPIRVRVFSSQSAGELNYSPPFAQVHIMDRLDLLKMPLQSVNNSRRDVEHSSAAAFALSNGYSPLAKINVFDP